MADMQWQDAPKDLSGLEQSRVSDVEVAREADLSIAPLLNDSTLLPPGLDKSIAEEPSDAMQMDFGFEQGNDEEMAPLPLEPPKWSLNGEEPSNQTLNISTDLNLSLHNGSRSSLDLALLPEDESRAQATHRPKKRKIGRDSVTELSSATIKKGMNDVSDITQELEITCKKAKVSHHGVSSLSYTTNVTELFLRPSRTAFAEDLMAMFSYSMKKRKFPLEEHKEGEEEDIEQMRRMSEVPVSHAE